MKAQVKSIRLWCDWIDALYGILASGVSTYQTKSPKAIKRIQRSFAIIFAALAAQLALSKQ